MQINRFVLITVLLLTAIVLYTIFNFYCERLEMQEWNKVIFVTEGKQGGNLPISGNGSHCFVTAYYDIGRSKWKSFRRRDALYFSRFEKLVELQEPLVAFVDERFLELALQILRKKRSKHVYTLIVSINEMFLKSHSHMWSLREREREIMNSELYKTSLSLKYKDSPEHNIPEYTLINHAKIDFVLFVIQHIHQSIRFERYSWIDFGYIQHDCFSPQQQPQRTKLDANTVTYMVVNDFDETDKDPLYALKHHPGRVAGGFFSGTVPVLTAFHSAYTKSVHDLHAINITDDDQAVVAYMHFHSPFKNFTFVRGSHMKMGLKYLYEGVVTGCEPF